MSQQLYPRNDITTAIYNRVSSLFGFEKAAQDHVVSRQAREISRLAIRVDMIY